MVNGAATLGMKSHLVVIQFFPRFGWMKFGFERSFSPFG
jgi:hypothetical protein